MPPNQPSNFRRLKFQLKLTWRPFAIGAIFKTPQSHREMCAGMPHAARRPTYSVNSVNLVLLDLLSSKLWFTPDGSDNSHFFKWLSTKMAVSMVSDPESEPELAESHLMLKNAWLCFRIISSSFVGNNQPVSKVCRKWCVKFQTTPSVRTGSPAVIQHSLSEHLKCLKSKTWNDLTSANLFFLERKMRSAAKRVEQSLGYCYLSKIEWFSLRPQQV